MFPNRDMICLGKIAHSTFMKMKEIWDNAEHIILHSLVINFGSTSPCFVVFILEGSKA